MSYNDFIANSNTAFAGGQHSLALDYANKAIKESPKEAIGYICAGKASMALSKLDNAVKNFEKAVEIEPKSGSTFFLLGYAQAMANKTAQALQSLTRAVENNCSDDIKAQIYKIMSLINTEKGDYENALVNLSQSEKFGGVDYELLQERAACYGRLNDYQQMLFTLNQMKLLQPVKYIAYSLAFNLFMKLGIYDEAEAELKRAEEFAKLDMTYYNDKLAFAANSYPDKKDAESVAKKLQAALAVINDSLQKGKPTAEDVFELYMRAAQIYVTVENPKFALSILDAAFDPVSAFNDGFSIYPQSDEKEANKIDIPQGLTPEEEEAIMQEKWDNGEFDDIRDKIDEALMEAEAMTDDPEELAEEIHKFLTPVDAIPAEKEEKEDTKYTLSEEFKMTEAQSDMRNTIYISAYEATKDYDSMLSKAQELQSSKSIANQYSGIYYELKAGKYTNKENWEKKYKERISFWTKRMIENPTDFVSASFRIRSYIDIGEYEKAEQLCECMPAEVKEPLMIEINKARSGGGENVDSH